MRWPTILNKRDGYREAFDSFDVQKVACYNAMKIDKPLLNTEIVRNKLKMNAMVTNAKAFLQTQQEFGSFDNYILQFVNGKPIQNS